MCRATSRALAVPTRLLPKSLHPPFACQQSNSGPKFLRGESTVTLSLSLKHTLIAVPQFEPKSFCRNFSGKLNTVIWKSIYQWVPVRLRAIPRNAGITSKTPSNEKRKGTERVLDKTPLE